MSKMIGDMTPEDWREFLRPPRPQRPKPATPPRPVEPTIENGERGPMLVAALIYGGIQAAAMITAVCYAAWKAAQ